MSSGKTNAVRILESLHIEHKVFEYESDDEALDAVTVAGKIGAAPESVFKTLVARGDKTGIGVFCIPGNFDLDLKKAAAVSGNKKIEMIQVKELLPLTGYIRGGCSPIGMKKRYPTYIDETALLHDEIFVSAGVRGQQLRIAPGLLAQAAEAEFADLT